MVSVFPEDSMHIPCSHSVASPRECFSCGGQFCLSRRSLEMFRDIFSCCNEGLPAPREPKPGILLSTLQCTSQPPPTKNYLVQMSLVARLRNPVPAGGAFSVQKSTGLQRRPLFFPLKCSTSSSLITLVGQGHTSSSLPHCFVSPQSWVHDQSGWPFLYGEGQFFVWVGEPLKTGSYNVRFKSSLSFLPKRQISPNQGEQGKEETGCIYWKPQRTLGKFGSRSRCPLGGGRCLQYHRKTSSVARPVSSAELLKGRHKNGIRQKLRSGHYQSQTQSKGLVLDGNI